MGAFQENYFRVQARIRPTLYALLKSTSAILKLRREPEHHVELRGQFGNP
jgi:hypothetical protein